MAVQETKKELEETPLDPKSFGLVCPKDPNRESTDRKRPPTHLASEVLKIDIDQSPMLSPQQIRDGKKRKPSVATLRCNTCQHEWDVKPWPPRG